jgi:hypothetical protein
MPAGADFLDGAVMSERPLTMTQLARTSLAKLGPVHFHHPGVALYLS